MRLFNRYKYSSSCTDMKPDPRSCTPDTPGICHKDATCTPVKPYVCSSTRPMSYSCECNQGFTGDGIDCTGELINGVSCSEKSRMRRGCEAHTCRPVTRNSLVIFLFLPPTRVGLIIREPHTYEKRDPFLIRVARIFPGVFLGVHFSYSKKLTIFFSRRYV